MIQSWAIVPKDNDQAYFPWLFSQTDSKSEIHVALEEYIVDKGHPLTHANQTCEWFTLQAFHLTATMAAKNINLTIELVPKTMLEMLLSSWFTRTRSSREMVIGAKNEKAVLTTFIKNDYVEQVFSANYWNASAYPG